MRARPAERPNLRPLPRFRARRVWNGDITRAGRSRRPCHRGRDGKPTAHGAKTRHEAEGAGTGPERSPDLVRCTFASSSVPGRSKAMLTAKGARFGFRRMGPPGRRYLLRYHVQSLRDAAADCAERRFPPSGGRMPHPGSRRLAIRHGAASSRRGRPAEPSALPPAAPHAGLSRGPASTPGHKPGVPTQRRCRGCTRSASSQLPPSHRVVPPAPARKREGPRRHRATLPSSTVATPSSRSSTIARQRQRWPAPRRRPLAETQLASRVAAAP